MKKMVFTVLASVMLMTPAMAAQGKVANTVQNIVGTGQSVLGGGSGATGGTTNISGGPDLSTGPNLGIFRNPVGQDDGATNGFYFGAQSDGNGFVALQVTKTLFKF